MARIEITRTPHSNGVNSTYIARYTGFWNFEHAIGFGYFEEEAIADLHRQIAERKATLEQMDREQSVYYRETPHRSYLARLKERWGR